MVAALSAFLLPFVDFDRGALKTIGTKSKLAKIENNISGEQMSRVVKVSIARLLSALFASHPLYRSPTLLDSTSPPPTLPLDLILPLYSYGRRWRSPL